MQEKLENIVSGKSFEALAKAKQIAEKTEELSKFIGIDARDLDPKIIETLIDIKEGSKFRTRSNVSSPRVAAQKEIKKIWP